MLENIFPIKINSLFDTEVRKYLTSRLPIDLVSQANDALNNRSLCFNVLGIPVDVVSVEVLEVSVDAVGVEVL